jgi:sugar phosphate isomerase/epimerase
MSETRTTIHPRISLNSICSMSQTLGEDFALWDDLGIDHIGLITPKIEAFGWDAGRQAVLDRGYRVSSLSCYKHELAHALEFTPTVGTDVLYFVPGSGGSQLWEETAEQFCAEMAPHAARAEELGLRVALEPTNPLRNDVSFVHTVRDAVHVARMAGLMVVVDVYSAWYERDIDAIVRDNIDLVVLVQIGDYKFGTFDIPNRVAIGDGDVPVERFLGMVLDAGYQGAFDLEILGPRLEEEGYRAPIARSLDRASEMLERLGA